MTLVNPNEVRARLSRWQDEALKAGLMDDKNPKRRVQSLHDVRFEGLSDLLLRDIFGPGMAAAEQWFSEVKECESKFVALDLIKGADALQQAFGNQRYDIVLMLGVLHKLKREMKPEAVSGLMRNLGQRAIEYFGWSGYTEEIPQLDFDMGACGLKRIHTSEMAGVGHPAAIWGRR